MSEDAHQTGRDAKPDLNSGGDAPDFRTELRHLINRHNMENGSDTPDFILNQFLADVLMTFDRTMRLRERWYGREPQPSDCGLPAPASARATLEAAVVIPLKAKRQEEGWPPTDACLAYSAYCDAVGGKAFNGDPLPDWKTFRADPAKAKQADAWEAAARALSSPTRHWTKETMDALAEEQCVEGALLADGYEAAFLGYGTMFSHAVAVYNYEHCIRILQERDGMGYEDDGMSYEEAVEFFEFNTAGAWVGENTPVFLHTPE